MEIPPEMKGLEMSVLLTAVQTELTNTEKVRLTDEHTTTGPNLEHLENKEITTNSNSNETIADLASFNQHDTITGTQKIPVIKSTSDSDYSKTSKGTENDIKKKPYGGRPLRFQCPNCERRFHAPSHLKRHMLCHSSERPFQCHVCKKGFLQAWHLGRHMTTHTGNKPFNCPECPKSFGSRFEMKTHCNYIHRGIKEHECGVCKKMFTLRSNLKVHMRKHTGEKPYECHICLKKFGQRGHLQYHVRKHSNAVEKEEQRGNHSIDSLSDQCSPTMTDYRRRSEKEESQANYDSGVEVESISSDRSSPKRVLTDHFDETPRTSPTHISLERYSSLKEYEREYIAEVPTTPLSGRMFDHTNPLELKPFVCDSCNCGFAEISSLRAHVRHSHPKKGITIGSYSCAYCSQSFEEIDHLREHFQVRHRLNEVITNKPISPVRPVFIGEKRRNTLEERREDAFYPVKRSRSAPTHSPESKCFDITYDCKPGRIVSERSFQDAALESCSCCPKPRDMTKHIYSDVVQERYLYYLEQYQRLLESHVDLIDALHAK